MRVHSIVSVEAREALAEAGGENARSRHGSPPWLVVDGMRWAKKPVRADSGMLN